jgi:hypothetical protein
MAQSSGFRLFTSRDTELWTAGTHKTALLAAGLHKTNFFRNHSTDFCQFRQSGRSSGFDLGLCQSKTCPTCLQRRTVVKLWLWHGHPAGNPMVKKAPLILNIYIRLSQRSDSCPGRLYPSQKTGQFWMFRKNKTFCPLQGIETWIRQILTQSRILQ